MPQKFEITIPDGIVRVRLEEYLFERFYGLSRMYLRDVIKNGQCEVNGRIENKGKRISRGDFVEIELDLERESAMRLQELPLDIVYEDSDLIVINKLAGMLVHPTHREKSGTVLNALSYYLNAEFGRRKAELANGNSTLSIPRSAFVRPGLVHRLDKETSGLLLVAKNTRSHRLLAKQFRLRTVKKSYLALVEGIVKDDVATIDAPIGRFEEKKSWNVKAEGKPAETRFRVLERRRNSTLLELEPVTGRTNQLRIHCASVDHPIVGDVKRGGREFERLCLHSSRISFVHPTGGERISLESLIQFRELNGAAARR
ncbi:MAG TPA: RluA family pseudouridine synthase [Pyrinomonadaceae bacterium]|nr:RluA family pseudouridine synthase [Pyrinomonadaceae bacterium]